MFIKKIDHVQLAMPAGEEDSARAFYQDILGVPEAVKPTELAKRGGVWFELGTVKIHLGVETNFRPAKKAHPGFEVTDLEGLSQILKDHGYNVIEDFAIPSCNRFFVHDPFGNRLEFIEPKKFNQDENS